MTEEDHDAEAQSSAGKVARAAQAGHLRGSRRARSGRAPFEFRSWLAAVVIIGMFLVGFAWNTRDVSALTPSFSDHWHVAYGVWDCEIEDFRPNLIDPQSPNSGIHTHSDGVIHIHPYSSIATGNGAVVERFLEGTGSTINDDEVMSFLDQPRLTEETTCDGQETILQIARFQAGGTEPVEIVTENLGQVPFLEDQEMLVFALAPAGATIPPPPQANIAEARNSSPFVFRTDGVNGLGHNDAVGFDGDGNLRDRDDNLILDENGNPVNINDIAPTSEEG